MSRILMARILAIVDGPAHNGSPRTITRRPSNHGQEMPLGAGGQEFKKGGVEPTAIRM